MEWNHDFTKKKARRLRLRHLGHQSVSVSPRSHFQLRGGLSSPQAKILVVFGIKIIDFPLEIDFRTLQKAKKFRLRRKNPRKHQIINLAV